MKVSEAKSLRLPLIVVSVVLLLVVGMVVKPLITRKPPSVLVTIAFPDANRDALVDSLILALKQPVKGKPHLRFIVFASSASEATLLFEPGTDLDAAKSFVQTQIQIVKDNLSLPDAHEGIHVRQAEKSRLIYVNISSTRDGLDRTNLYSFSRMNVLPHIEQLPEIASISILGIGYGNIRINLDLERMRRWNLSPEYVLREMQDASAMDWPQETGHTSKTIEYTLPRVSRHDKRREHENIILRAFPDGKILRFKDIATVDWVPLYPFYYDADANIDHYPPAVIILKVRPEIDTAVAMKALKKKLNGLKKELFSSGITPDISDDFPATWTDSVNRSQPENH